MSALENVEELLSKNEQQIEQLVERLEDQKSIEELLDETQRGVGKAGENLAQLAESTKVIMIDLKQVLTSCQDAVEILKRSNPEKVLEAVESSGQQLELLHKKISSRIGRTMYASFLTLIVVFALLGAGFAGFFAFEL